MLKLELCQNGDWNISRDGKFIGWMSHVYQEWDKWEGWVFYTTNNTIGGKLERLAFNTKDELLNYLRGDK